jgi:sugar/nucleoside kinase (ribokinase family)
MNITILGHVCIDQNVSEQASYTAAGGPAMFMQKILQQLPDNQVTIIAPYGTDFLPYAPTANLYPTQPTSDQTLTYENVSRAGVRVQKAYHRQAAQLLPIDPTIQALVAASDIIFIAPLLPNFSPDYLRQILSSAQPTALKILLPQGYYRNFDSEDRVMVRAFSEATPILPLINLVIVSDQDHPEMLALAKVWSDQFKILVVTTLGKAGAVAMRAGTATPLPTRIVPANEVVDSVGSGDIFSAGFGYRYRQTQDITEAGRFANELARQCLFFTPEKIRLDVPALFNQG